MKNLFLAVLIVIGFVFVAASNLTETQAAVEGKVVKGNSGLDDVFVTDTAVNVGVYTNWWGRFEIVKTGLEPFGLESTGFRFEKTGYVTKIMPVTYNAGYTLDMGEIPMLRKEL